MKLTYLVCGALLALTATSCDTIYDHEGDCESHYLMRFKFDYNILEADAFHSQVGAVRLWAIDPETRQVVKTWTESGEALKLADYAIEMDLPAGTYDFLCWAGDGATDPNQFVIDSKNLSCEIVDHPGQKLKPLFYGSLSQIALPEGEGTYYYTCPLIKDTNYLNISLVHLGAGKEMGKDDFKFQVTSSDAYMDSCNRLIPPRDITYTPFAIVPQQVSTETDNSGLMAEITTGRIMADGNSRLTVTNTASGKPVLSVPLAKLLLAVKGNYHEHWTEQEYLDRQDEYRLIFFLKDDDHWMNAYIYVNSWKVVLQDIDL